jgi:Holliday junction resolvase RusA-like endonuclease
MAAPRAEPECSPALGAEAPGDEGVAEAGRLQTLAAGVRKGDPDIPANIKAVFTFHPPDRRRRDLDNLLASCKPMIDGIADTIGRDDSTWQIELRKAEIRKGGAVRIELEAA